MKKKVIMKEPVGRRRGAGVNAKKQGKLKKAVRGFDSKHVSGKAGVPNAGRNMRALGRNRGRGNHTEGFLIKFMPELMAIANSSPIPQFAIDHDHRILYWNKALEKISRIKAADIVGTKHQWKAFYDKRRPTLADLLIEDDIKGISNWYGSKCSKSKYVVGAYEGTDYFPELEPKGRWLFFTAALIKDAGGKVVGAVETLEDITERKLAELKLRESEDRFRTIATNLPAAVYQFYVRDNGEMGLYYADDRCLEIFGIENTPIETFFERYVANVHPEDRESFMNSIRGCARNAADWDWEGRYVKPRGFEMWTRVFSRPTRRGTELIYNGLMIDITDRKLAELKLRESEERFRQLVENAGEIILVAQNNMLKYVNPMTTRVTSFSEKELYARPFLDFIHPDDRDLVAERYRKRISGEEIPSVYQFRLINKDGGIRWVEINAVGIIWDKSPATLNFIQDVTARKRAENALRESEEKYRNVLDTMEEGLYENDLKGNFTFVNNAAARQVGYTHDELIGMNYRRLFSSEISRHLYGVFKRIYETGEPEFLMDYEVIRKDGTVRTHQANAQLILDPSGKPMGFRSLVRDVTTLKKAEEALRESENKYRELVENANSIILRMDTLGNVTFFNEFAQSFFGYTSDEIMGKNVVGTIVPETDSSGKDLGDLIRDIAQNTEKYKNNENENIKKSGERVWISWTNKVIQDKRGKVKEILCIGNDITAHKKSEDALRKSEMKFRDLADFLPEIVFELDVHGNVRYINRMASALLGYSLGDQARGLSIYDLFLPDDRDRVRTNFQNILNGKISAGDEYVMLKKDQTAIPVMVHSRAIKPDGGITGIRGIIVDISERKKADNALRESEEKFRRLFEDSGVAQLLLDGNRIVDCNMEAMKMMGCGKKDQLIQKFIHDISSEVQPEGESSMTKAKKYVKLALQQRSITFEWQLRRLDGSLLTAEITVTAIPMSGKDILHANMRDITERKRLQNEIINIIDVEQQRLGRNLHDGLGQDLTGVAFMCNTLTKKLKEAGFPETAMSEEITSLVYHVITRVRMISRELYPPNLVENEITYTLQQFAANISSMFGISCTFVQDPVLVISDIFISTQIYYIVREAVNNSVKHGQAKNIIISLTHNKNDVILVIEDDGIGRSESMDKYKGLGLRIMAYRMGTMNGTFSILDNYKGRGVIVFCTFPVFKLQKEH
jgi:PAS domain S-box-containing protein